jgi:hypothetical protein
MVMLRIYSKTGGIQQQKCTLQNRCSIHRKKMHWDIKGTDLAHLCLSKLPCCRTEQQGNYVSTSKVTTVLALMTHIHHQSAQKTD